MNEPTVRVQYGIDRKTNEPVVVLQHGTTTTMETFAAMTIAQANNFAADIVQACARAEADAMIFKFFYKQGYPEGAAEALMHEFRKFRAILDAELVQRSMDEPTLNGPS